MILLALIALAARASAAPREDPFALAARYANAMTGVEPDDARPAAADGARRDELDREDEEAAGPEDAGEVGDDRAPPGDGAVDAYDRAGSEAPEAGHGARAAQDTDSELDPLELRDLGELGELGDLGDVAALGELGEAPHADAGQPDSAAYADAGSEAASATLAEPERAEPWRQIGPGEPAGASEAGDLGLRTWAVPAVPMDVPPEPPPSDPRPPRWGRLDVGFSWHRRWSEPRHAPARRLHEVWLVATWRR